MKLAPYPESRGRHPLLAAIVAATTVLMLGSGPALSQEPDVKDVLQHDEAQETEPAATEQPSRGPADEFNRGTPVAVFRVSVKLSARVTSNARPSTSTSAICRKRLETSKVPISRGNSRSCLIVRSGSTSMR